MANTLPGQKLWENATAYAVANPAALTSFIDTTGFTSLLLTNVITNTTGTTTFTVEGSFDGVTQDTTMPYTAVTTSSAAAGTVITVQHTYVRFRVVQATAAATVSTFYVQSRA